MNLSHTYMFSWLLFPYHWAACLQEHYISSSRITFHVGSFSFPRSLSYSGPCSLIAAVFLIYGFILLMCLTSNLLYMQAACCLINLLKNSFIDSLINLFSKRNSIMPINMSFYLFLESHQTECVLHISSSSSWKAEAGEPPWVWGQPGLYSDFKPNLH